MKGNIDTYSDKGGCDFDILFLLELIWSLWWMEPIDACRLILFNSIFTIWKTQYSQTKVSNTLASTGNFLYPISSCLLFRKILVTCACFSSSPNYSTLSIKNVFFLLVQVQPYSLHWKNFHFRNDDMNLRNSFFFFYLLPTK